LRCDFVLLLYGLEIDWRWAKCFQTTLEVFSQTAEFLLEFVLAGTTEEVAADKEIELGNEVVHNQGLVVGGRRRKSSELFLDL